jgi:monovalent cation/hydrogen antiporter
MILFELVIALLLVGAVLALWADRVGIPYPALLALAGAALALLPGTPQVTLDPQLALALFVAPVLLDAAYDASPRDLKANLIPVVSLALGMVALTIGAVALVARAVVPDMSWAVAIALGAIVAPSDASAATAVLRRLQPPHRILVILQGESLFNDASALLVFRMAVAAAMSGAVSGWSVVPTFLLTCGGGVIVGVLLARMYMWLTSRVDDIPVSILLQFVGTFAVWILADQVGLSAIITVVSYAMTLARRAPGRTDARHRISSYAVWEVAVFVLNVLAFVLIGLQLRTIVTRMHGSDWHTYALCGGAVCLTVILVRIAWVMSHTAIVRGWAASRKGTTQVPTFRGSIVVSWCGMRGIVTLAAALALPDGSPSEAFPYRDLVILCAFYVVLFTLVVQGMSIRPLLTVMRLKDDGSVEREVRIARAETARAALRILDEHGAHPSMESLRGKYEARLRSNEGRTAPPAPAAEGDTVTDLQRRAVWAQRRVLMDLRDRAVIGDDAFHAAEEELDLLELTADARIHPQA